MSFGTFLLTLCEVASINSSNNKYPLRSLRQKSGFVLLGISNLLVENSENIVNKACRLSFSKSIIYVYHLRKLFLETLHENKPYDEVLGAAQFTECTSISCQKLSKIVKICQ